MSQIISKLGLSLVVSSLCLSSVCYGAVEGPDSGELIEAARKLRLGQSTTHIRFRGRLIDLRTLGPASSTPQRIAVADVALLADNILESEWLKHNWITAMSSTSDYDDFKRTTAAYMAKALHDQWRLDKFGENDFWTQIETFCNYELGNRADEAQRNFRPIKPAMWPNAEKASASFAKMLSELPLASRHTMRLLVASEEEKAETLKAIEKSGIELNVSAQIFVNPKQENSAIEQAMNVPSEFLDARLSYQKNGIQSELYVDLIFKPHWGDFEDGSFRPIWGASEDGTQSLLVPRKIANLGHLGWISAGSWNLHESDGGYGELQNKELRTRKVKVPDPGNSEVPRLQSLSDFAYADVNAFGPLHRLAKQIIVEDFYNRKAVHDGKKTPDIDTESLWKLDDETLNEYFAIAAQDSVQGIEDLSGEGAKDTYKGPYSVESEEFLSPAEARFIRNHSDYENLPLEIQKLDLPHARLTILAGGQSSLHYLEKLLSETGSCQFEFLKKAKEKAKLN